MKSNLISLMCTYVLIYQDFDDNLGPVEYTSARRKNVVTMTVPFEDEVLFVAAEPDVDIDKTARKI